MPSLDKVNSGRYVRCTPLIRPLRLFLATDETGMRPLGQLYDFVSLGAIHGLTDIEDGQQIRPHKGLLRMAALLLQRFIEYAPNVEMLPGSSKLASELLDRVEGLCERNDVFNYVDAALLKANLASFQTLLEHELSLIRAYVIEDVRGY